MELHFFEEALASFNKAVELKPGYAGAVYNRGTVLREMNRLDEAFASFDNAIALKPDYAEPHSSRSMLKLLLGRYGEAWPEFEWRDKLKEVQGRSPSMLRIGKGRTLPAAPSRSMPNSILATLSSSFAYLPLLAQRGAKVSFAGPSKLVRLLRTLGAHVSFLDPSEGRRRFDYQCG